MFLNKAWKFVKKNFFYIGLVLCVVVIGAVTVISSLPRDKAEDPAKHVENPTDQTLTEATKPRPTQTAKVSDAPQSSPKKSTSGGTHGKTTFILTKPLDGELITAFSGDTLVFNSTVNMWMTHNGVDISAQNNTDVVAALPGEILSVKNDDSKGKTVEISHGENTKTVYAGLSDVIAEEGAKINAGQKIGTAGTPSFEADKGAHLHFEYIVDGKFKDPAEYFS